ncbi:SAM-dependent methyltransferase [Amycolatopsis sp. YIM 10]|uniref:SAM-dependent methyltransferase n=1 Tax=Amycolatopsis sp. YIM 10 TaxID=2653857 RepID=UPI0012903324|nr:SAM-dependent methyltransferase [Amycolatopsis sp. YIM 10]QFU91822.1 S-adenosyl methyltransferase [Amycolatopsis sp. YIM 10]
MTDERRVPPPVGVDPSRASIARVYDAALGGKDNYEIDREVLAQVAKVAPEVNDLARSNRKFLVRACRFLATKGGITQFLDCGSGLPTAENTHQIVQRVDQGNRVVYVDNDPVVISHGKALLVENDRTHFADADIFTPADVLGNDVVREHIDFTEPLALLQVGTLHHYTPDNGAELMKEYVDALPSGSYVAIAHFFNPETDELAQLAQRMEDVFLHSPMGSGRFRTADEIRAFFPGLELMPPNPEKPGDLELCDLWWPTGPTLRPLNQVERCIVGAVGRKP